MYTKIANGLLDMHSVITGTDVLGVILAGGKSSRMGRDKAKLPYKNKRLIDQMLDLLASTSVKTILVSGEFDGLNCITDIIKEAGPIGAIYSVLQQVDPKLYGAILFIPVDMPLLTSNVLEHLITNLGQHDAVYYAQRPLPTLLRKCPSINDLLTSWFDNDMKGNYSVKKLLNQLDSKQLPIPHELINQFANINTPSEWEQLRKTS